MTELTSRRILRIIVAITFAAAGCKDMGTDSPGNSAPAAFTASTVSLSVQKGASATVSLSGGTTPYSISTAPNNLRATAVLTSSTLTVTGVDTGTTFVVVQDSKAPVPDSIRISISISSTTPSVSFSSQIQPIFNTACTGCHGSSGGLSLVSAYNNLVGVQAQSSCTTMLRVAPGSADNSVLYKKVSGTSCGTQMPQGGSLTTQQIDRIRDWINQGALNN